MNDKEIEAEIQDKGLTAPRVTPASIEAKIVGEYYFTASQGCYGADGEGFRGNPDEIPGSLHRLTMCVLTLENGFTILGKSAPASAENFDAELGRKIARADAVNQIWPLEGYFRGRPLILLPMQRGATNGPHTPDRAKCLLLVGKR
jgi:hypothetical protein